MHNFANNVHSQYIFTNLLVIEKLLAGSEPTEKRCEEFRT